MNYLTSNVWQTDSVTNLITALIAFNKDFDEVTLKKDAQNPHLKNKYVSLDNLLNTVRPILTKNNLVFTQELAGESLVTCIYHSSGEFKGSAMPFYPMSENRGTNLLQNIGGGITYAKRYALSALLGISVDTDDDGNNMPKAKEQTKTIERKKVEDKNMTALIDYAKTNHLTVEEILKSRDLTQKQIELLEKSL